jgi:hypothetical protein
MPTEPLHVYPRSCRTTARQQAISSTNSASNRIVIAGKGKFESRTTPMIPDATTSDRLFNYLNTV